MLVKLHKKINSPAQFKRRKKKVKSCLELGRKHPNTGKNKEGESEEVRERKLFTVGN